MKIVIDTQILENYAAHAGFSGEYRWKHKGGNTYVVPNLSVEQVIKIKEHGVPTLTALIETRDDSYQEYILDWNILDDHEVACREWETPYELYWEQGRWVARRSVHNVDGIYSREIAVKIEQYDMLMGGGRENYEAKYIMTDGSVKYHL